MAENNYNNDNNIEIPENADKILFAEDLIRYVMLRNASVPYSAWRAEPYREFIYNGFNETTEMAVWFLDRSMAMEYCRVFHYLQNEDAVNHETYTKLANDVIVKFFSEGFDANRFLNYCVLLASLAAYFYTSGMTDAPNLAVLYIVKAIQDIDMTTGGWDTLNRSAKRYATMAEDSLDTLSPESSNSDEDAAEADLFMFVSESDPVAGSAESDHRVEITGESDRDAVQDHSVVNEEDGAAESGSSLDEKSVQNPLDRTKSVTS